MRKIALDLFAEFLKKNREAMMAVRDDVAKAIADKRLILFVGAGVSAV